MPEPTVELIIQSFSALPGSLLFEEGETYYFIVPNYGRELEDIEEINSDGGLCRSHNIRFAIHVRPGTYTQIFYKTPGYFHSFSRKSKINVML